MKNTLFTGSGVAIVTPMSLDGSINYEVYKELLEFNIKNGTDAIIVCGTTGESATMTDDEHIEIIKYTIDTVAGRVPVIAGTGSNDTAYSVGLTKEAKRLGADGTLQATPYYNKTSQRGLLAHFGAIADVGLPVVLYNVPSRTGMTISSETYAELANHKNIVAAKEASSDIAAIAKSMSLVGDKLDFYSGNDDQIIPIMSLGGKGVISVLGNVVPQITHDMCMAYLNGDVNTARDLQLKYMPLANVLFCDVNPIAVKEAMNILGFDCGSPRLPLIDLSAENKKLLESVMKSLNVTK